MSEEKNITSKARKAAQLMANQRWEKEKPDKEFLRKIGSKGGKKNRGKKRNRKKKEGFLPPKNPQQ